MQIIVVGRLTRSLRLSRSSDRAVYAGRAASLLFLELIYTFIVAQASCLWGNRASRLVKLIVAAGKMPAGPTARMAVLLRVTLDNS